MQAMLAALTSTDEIDVPGRGHEIDASIRLATQGEINLLHATYGNGPTQILAQEDEGHTVLRCLMTAGSGLVDGQESVIRSDETAGPARYREGIRMMSIGRFLQIARWGVPLLCAAFFPCPGGAEANAGQCQRTSSIQTNLPSRIIRLRDSDSGWRHCIHMHLRFTELFAFTRTRV